MSDVTIEIATTATAELAAAFATLLPQLSSSAPKFTAADLAAMLASPGTTQFVATLDGRIVGVLTLVMFRIPTGLRVMIEDVVVDQSARGRGVAAALTLAALDRARAAGARTVDLTSRPSREAANRLYRKLGFVQRETNAYRYTL
jgi:ribosomal protein S18 acetylase RimI-like enzyme